MTPRLRGGWALWWRDMFGASLPLMLMALLALGTWWLVRHAPKMPQRVAAAAPGHDPDYRLEKFELERFDASGQLALTLRGQRLRHYPDTDELSIDVLHLTAQGRQAQQVEASASAAWVSAKGEQVRLEGSADVMHRAPGSEPVRIRGEQLLLNTRNHDVRADQPVQVIQGRNEFNADALMFDGTQQLLTLHGPARAVFQPQH